MVSFEGVGFLNLAQRANIQCGPFCVFPLKLVGSLWGRKVGFRGLVPDTSRCARAGERSAGYNLVELRRAEIGGLRSQL